MSCYIGAPPMRTLNNSDLARILKRTPVNPAAGLKLAALREKVILVTGAAGSLGRSISSCLARSKPRRLLLLDRSEADLAELEQELGDLGGEVRYVLGDVRDAQLLLALFCEEGVQWVVHAAALKHVVLLEREPLEAVRVNVEGTACLLECAARQGVERLLFISTDKAADPVSVMGRTKRLGEELVLAVPGLPETLVLRLVNVLGSRGSLLPLLQRRLERGRPLGLTRLGASRHFITPGEAAGLVLLALLEGPSGRVLVPRQTTCLTVGELVRRLLALLGKEPGTWPPRESGLRPGERLHEKLQGRGEREIAVLGSLAVLESRSPPWPFLKRGLLTLAAAVAARRVGEVTALLEALSTPASASRTLEEREAS